MTGPRCPCILVEYNAGAELAEQGCAHAGEFLEDYLAPQPALEDEFCRARTRFLL